MPLELEKEEKENETLSTIEKNYFLKVPQGCYAVIKPETPKEIKGIFTDGLGPCACLIITNPDRSRIFLAHVDDRTMNISDPESGIVSWIKTFEGESIDNLSIEIHCGKGFQNGVYPVNYEEIIKNILISSKDGFIVKHLKSLIEKIIMYEVGSDSASMILRKGTELINGYNDLEFDKDGRPTGLKIEIEEYYEIIEFPNIHRWRNSLLGCGDIEEIKNLTLKKPHRVGRYTKLKYDLFNSKELPLSGEGKDSTLPFPPICCYDGERFFDGKTKAFGRTKKYALQSLRLKILSINSKIQNSN